MSDTREDTTTDAPEDRTEAGQEHDYHGDATPDSPTAPASTGLPHGADGTVDPTEGGPDGRPNLPEAGRAAGDRGARDETPVQSPIDRSVARKGTGTGSAAAASAAAGSGAPVDESEGGREGKSES